MTRKTTEPTPDEYAPPVRYRAGTLQIPPVVHTGAPYTGRAHRATGIRCPRCQEREVVYNGNYFCAGFDSGECRWALPGDEEPRMDPDTGDWYDNDPAWWDLEDMLILVGCAGGRRGSAW